MKKNYKETDHENRRRILESVNPRVTIMKEATNNTNPITKRNYTEDDNTEIGIRRLYSNVIYIDSSGLIECQKALARMELRDNRLGIYEHGRFIDTLSKLISDYNKARLTLSSITDASGLDSALSATDNKIANEFFKITFEGLIADRERADRERGEKEKVSYNPISISKIENSKREVCNEGIRRN